MRKNIGRDLQALMARNHETYVHLWSTSPNTVFEDTLEHVPEVLAGQLRNKVALKTVKKASEVPSGNATDKVIGAGLPCGGNNEYHTKTNKGTTHQNATALRCSK